METRQIIFDKAVALLERHGSATFSMRNLANEVHVTPMALYRHYTNRDALLTAVADHYFDSLAARWQSYTTDNHHEQSLLLIGRDLIDFYLEHPHIYQLMFIEPRVNARQLPADASSSESPTFTIVVASVQRGIAAGELHGAQAPEIALALAGQLHGLAALHQGGRLKMPPTEFRKFCQKVLVRAINAYKVNVI